MRIVPSTRVVEEYINYRLSEKDKRNKGNVRISTDSKDIYHPTNYKVIYTGGKNRLKKKYKDFTVEDLISIMDIVDYCLEPMTKEELREYKKAYSNSYNKGYYEENSDKWKDYNYDDGNYIYYYKVGKKIVYIGETDNLNERINRHVNGNGNYDLFMDYILDNDYDLYTAVLPDEFTKWERKFVEKILIEKYNSKTNKNSNRSHLYLTESRQEELRKLADELEFVKVFTEECYIC